MAEMLIFASCFIGIKAKHQVLYFDIAQARQCFKCFSPECFGESIKAIQ